MIYIYIGRRLTSLGRLSGDVLEVGVETGGPLAVPACFGEAVSPSTHN